MMDEFIEEQALTNRPFRVAVLNSHPTQYSAPLFRFLAQDPRLDIHVFFESRGAVGTMFDPGFNQAFQWDTPLLEGYASTVLVDESQDPGLARRPLRREIGHLLRKGKFDALWVHGHSTPTTLWAVAAARASGIPIFTRGETHLGLRRAGLKRLIRRPVMYAYYSLFDGCLAIGTKNSEFYQWCGVRPERVFPVPYVVDNNFFAAAADAARASRLERRRAFGIPDEAPVVLYASKLIERKHPGDVIIAHEQLRDSGIPVHTIMAGSGPLETELRASAIERGVEGLYFPGFVNQEELPRYFAAADVFVLPAEDEPWGLIINEAMCAGLPIVAATEIGAVADLVRDGENGRTFPVRDIEALVEALKFYCIDSARRSSAGIRSRQIISKWSFAECRDGLLAALSAVAR